MEKLNKTTKYFELIKIALIAIVFSVATPAIVNAQYTDIGSGSGLGYSNDNSYTDIGSGNGLGYSNDNPYTDIGSGSGLGYTINNNTANTPNTGNYPNNGSNYYRGYSTVTSGGFSMGNTVVTVLAPYVPPTTILSTGNPTIGTNDFNDIRPYVPQSNTVVSGGYLMPNQNQIATNSQPTLQIVPNQVLAYTDTNPSLNSVYLSDVPYTGFEDYYGILIFISILVSFSAIVAYIILKRKISSQEIPVAVSADENEIKNNESTFVSNFVNQNKSDISDINKVEEYARMNKVLLSSDAAAKIVKLSRIGKINASEYIRSVAKGEWVAIGEEQILS